MKIFGDTWETMKVPPLNEREQFLMKWLGDSTIKDYLWFKWESRWKPNMVRIRLRNKLKKLFNLNK